MNADEEWTEQIRKCWKICYFDWNECSHTSLPSFRHTLAEVRGFIMSWLQFPVFTEPTFVPSTTSSKVNTTPLAAITAQVWH